MNAYVEVMGFRFPLSTGSARVACPVVLGLVAGVLLLFAGAAQRDSWLLAVEGVTVQAEVIDLRSKQSDRHRRGRTQHSTSYVVTLGFVAEGTGPVMVEKSVSRRQYFQLGVGRQLTIRYARSRPHLIELRPGDAAMDAVIAWLLAAMAVCLAIGSAGWAWRPRQDLGHEGQ